MKLEQAKQKLQEGEKLTHRFFGNDEELFYFEVKLELHDNSFITQHYRASTGIEAIDALMPVIDMSATAAVLNQPKLEYCIKVRPTYFQGSMLCYVPIDYHSTAVRFGGVPTTDTQVLKSAAGYYIGSLCFEADEPTFWEPYHRDSEQYWPTRNAAEDAMLSGKYSNKN